MPADIPFLLRNLKPIISVVTINVFGIPLITKDYKKRMKLTIQELQKINADIICIQEMWMNKDKKQFIKSLKTIGYAYYYSPQNRFRLNGLLTLSKHPITFEKFVSTKAVVNEFNLSILEAPGDKGFQIVKVNIEDDNYTIFNAHLSAEFDSNRRESIDTPKFLEDELKFLGDEISSLEGDKTIVAGDFNISSDSVGYQMLVSSTGMRNVTLNLPNTASGGLFFIPTPVGKKKLDHVFVKNFNKEYKFKSRLVLEDKIDNIQLSDHKGIYTEIYVDT